MEIALGLTALAMLVAGIAYTRQRVAPKLSWQESAALALTGYGERLRGAAEEIEQPHADVFWDMAGHLEGIRVEVLDDPKDLAKTRKFIHHHARLVVELVEKFAKLHQKARPEHNDRLAQLGAQLHTYRDLFARVEKACIDSDFDDMEATMEALDLQLTRLAL